MKLKIMEPIPIKNKEKRSIILAKIPSKTHEQTFLPSKQFAKMFFFFRGN